VRLDRRYEPSEFFIYPSDDLAKESLLRAI